MSLTAVDASAMMEADQNGDGKLDFDEFKTMVANTDIAKQMVRYLVALAKYPTDELYPSQTLEGKSQPDHTYSDDLTNPVLQQICGRPLASVQTFVAFSISSHGTFSRYPSVPSSRICYNIVRFLTVTLICVPRGWLLAASKKGKIEHVHFVLSPSRSL